MTEPLEQTLEQECKSALDKAAEDTDTCCPHCDTTNTQTSSFLGTVGRVCYHRCRSCGWAYSILRVS